MKTLPLRLNPGDDLRAALDAALPALGAEAAFVVSGIGSLREARLRYAGRDVPHHVVGDLESSRCRARWGSADRTCTPAWRTPMATSLAAMSRRAASCARPPRSCWRCSTT